jgi:gliding motility-associated-like protein
VNENLDIEKLFKNKFENFEADVNPNLWNNIANGVQSSAVTTTTGLSFGVKGLIVASAISVISVATYYLGGFNQEDSNMQQLEMVVAKDENKKHSDKSQMSKNILTTIIAQDNDPIIDTHEEEIVNELSKHQNKVESTKEVTQVVDNSEINNSENLIDLPASTTGIGTTFTEDKTEESLTTKDKQTNTSTTKKHLEKNIVFPSGNIEFITTTNKFEYQFSANAVNNEKIIWYFGDGETSTEENPNHNYSSPGQYEVSLTIISKDNEVYQEYQTIEIKSTSSIDNIPNVITPNNDRINDEFVIKSTNIQEFNIVIKDQNGNVVFESNDKNFAWDGTNLSGERVINGIYIYYIFAKGTDNSIFKIPGQIYVR